MKKYKDDIRLKGKKILIVEDCDSLSNLLSAVLSHGGAEVFEARDGRKSIDMACKIDPDLIIMDVTLPGISGIEACKTLKAGEVTAACPILLISSDHATLERAAGEPRLIDEYLPKPFKPVELIEKSIEILLKSEHQTLNLK